MSYPLVGDVAAEGIPVRLTCGVLGNSTQAYYAWLASPASDRHLEDAYLTHALVDAHEDDPEFGYRFLADELERAGHEVGERRVWQLCSQQKLWSSTVRKGPRGSGKLPGPAVHDDLVPPAPSTSKSSMLSALDSIPASTVAVLAALLIPVGPGTVDAPATSGHSPIRSVSTAAVNNPPYDTRFGSSKLCVPTENA